jgi:hypothetical protein
MPIPNSLRYFKPGEFNNPTLVNEKAAIWLDVIRHKFGKPIIVTDDARIPGQALPSGASGRSLHFLGQAFDIRIRHWSREDMWLFVKTIVEFETTISGSEGGIELELVWSNRDKHAHVGFFLDGRPSRLIIAGD